MTNYLVTQGYSIDTSGWQPTRLRVAAGMVEEQVLRRDDVSLLRAYETVFNAAGLLAM